MKNIIIAVALFLPSCAVAQTVGSTQFAYMPAEDFSRPAFGLPVVKAVKIAASAHAPAPVLSVTEGKMLLDCGTNRLVAYTEDEAGCDKLISFWAPVLEKSGIKPGKKYFASGICSFEYAAPKGKVVRRFMADPQQFKPKDDVSRKENMAMTAAALEKAELPIAFSAMVDIPVIMLPTYAHYYLTDADANTDHEKQLRIMKATGDINMAILGKANITLVQNPNEWTAVYVGPLVSYIYRYADSYDAMIARVEKEMAWLESIDKPVIGWEVGELPEYKKWAAEIYFFQ